ncbi:hypothetical protein UFOVP411_8 [uncultured Caudovirales phage]|uniref:Uncharacterized protein n=1 Tax=uncultured Caudovirales phage TaxID=2100421 RepID=A0A6J5M2T0_9CAUD|nr:hypothetical protein UFOVP411_8 [uncultured Caudovirales phage]
MKLKLTPQRRRMLEDTLGSDGWTQVLAPMLREHVAYLSDIRNLGDADPATALAQLEVVESLVKLPDLLRATEETPA